MSRKLREGDRMLNEGTELTEVLPHLEVSESSWARWRAQCGGTKADEGKRHKELERENARLKKLLAEAELEKAMLKELAEGNFSERFACRVAGQHRSTQRKARVPRRIDDHDLRAELRSIAKAHPRWGYKMATRVVRRDGWHVNRKRVQRPWRDEGLKRPPQGRKRRRVRLDTTERMTALRPNHVWAIDFCFDETTDQRRLKVVNIVDEYTREALTLRVGRHCTADDLLVELDRLVDRYGAPASLRCDNGPELIAWALRDWCRMSCIGISYIEPGSPWENAYVESFNGRVRDELLNIEEFGSLLEAQVVVEAWRIEYNTYRPHGALGGLTPVEVRAAWTTEHQPALS